MALMWQEASRKISRLLGGGRYRVQLHRSSGPILLSASRGQNDLSLQEFVEDHESFRPLLDFVFTDPPHRVLMPRFQELKALLKEMKDKSVEVWVAPDVDVLTLISPLEGFESKYAWSLERQCLQRSFPSGCAYHGGGWFISPQGYWQVPEVSPEDEGWLCREEIEGKDLIEFLTHILPQWQTRGLPFSSPIHFVEDPVLSVSMAQLDEETLEVFLSWKAHPDTIHEVPELDGYVIAQDFLMPGISPDRLPESLRSVNGKVILKKDDILPLLREALPDLPIPSPTEHPPWNPVEASMEDVQPFADAEPLLSQGLVPALDATPPSQESPQGEWREAELEVGVEEENVLQELEQLLGASCVSDASTDGDTSFEASEVPAPAALEEPEESLIIPDQQAWDHHASGWTQADAWNAEGMVAASSGQESFTLNLENPLVESPEDTQDSLRSLFNEDALVDASRTPEVATEDASPLFEEEAPAEPLMLEQATPLQSAMEEPLPDVPILDEISWEDCGLLKESLETPEAGELTEMALTPEPPAHEVIEELEGLLDNWLELETAPAEEPSAPASPGPEASPVPSPAEPSLDDEMIIEELEMLMTSWTFDEGEPALQEEKHPVEDCEPSVPKTIQALADEQRAIIHLLIDNEWEMEGKQLRQVFSSMDVDHVIKGINDDFVRSFGTILIASGSGWKIICDEFRDPLKGLSG